MSCLNAVQFAVEMADLNDDKREIARLHAVNVLMGEKIHAAIVLITDKIERHALLIDVNNRAIAALDKTIKELRQEAEANVREIKRFIRADSL